MSRILIFERSPGLRRDLERAVRNAGYEVDAIGALSDLTSRIGQHTCRAALVEIKGTEDLEWLGRLARTPPQPIVFAMGSSPSVDFAIESMKQGARDYLRKPFRIDLLEQVLSSVLARSAPAHHCLGEGVFVTEDPALLDILRQSEAAAASNATVLILGESGTGKKTLARRIHRLSPRGRAPLVAIDCASLSNAGAEAELFGREPGALLEASEGRDGLVASADGGTLLLEGVGEASAPVQAVLLRLLQEREITAVGASVGRVVDCRTIATSRVDLRDAVAQGRFREDLFYRLDVVVLSLPPLRERKNDIRPLADVLLKRYSGEAGCEPPRFSDADFASLLEYPFRGNVRELDNLMQRAVVLFSDRTVDLERLLVSPGRILAASRAGTRSLNLRELEREAVERSLTESNGNRTHASQLLGINVRTLRNKIRAYGLV